MQTSEIDLRNDRQELDASRGEPEGSLKVTIQMPQQEGIPKGMRIMLLDKQSRNRTFQEVDASGQATIPILLAGKYSIQDLLPLIDDMRLSEPFRMRDKLRDMTWICRLVESMARDSGAGSRERKH